MFCTSDKISEDETTVQTPQKSNSGKGKRILVALIIVIALIAAAILSLMFVNKKKLASMDYMNETEDTSDEQAKKDYLSDNSVYKYLHIARNSCYLSYCSDSDIEELIEFPNSQGGEWIKYITYQVEHPDAIDEEYIRGHWNDWEVLRAATNLDDGELAIAKMAMDKTKGIDEQANIVSEWDINDATGLLVLAVFGDANWEDYTSEEKDMICQQVFVRNPIYDETDMYECGTLLEYIGYDVEYTSEGGVSANW